MGENTAIEWCHHTFNPIWGCVKVSPGCEHCYAEGVAHRQLQEAHRGLTTKGPSGVRWNGEVRCLPERLDWPLGLRKPQRIFVNSMSDLFHEKIPEDYIHRVFDVMKRADWHQFQVLTKRSERLLELSSGLSWPENVWMGVSVESGGYKPRIEHLAQTGAAVKFLSIEPLIGAIGELPLDGINWVIIGGESGPKARPMELDWAREVRDQCVEHGVSLFLKQLGGRGDKRGGDRALLDGRRWTEYPVVEQGGCAVRNVLFE